MVASYDRGGRQSHSSKTVEVKIKEKKLIYNNQSTARAVIRLLKTEAIGKA